MGISRINLNTTKNSWKKKSREHALNFDQWQTFLEKYKPVKVSLWLVYKIIKNNCRLQLFATSLLKLKEVSNLETTRHMMSKSILRTKLLQNLLFAIISHICCYNFIDLLYIVNWYFFEIEAGSDVTVSLYNIYTNVIYVFMDNFFNPVSNFWNMNRFWRKVIPDKQVKRLNYSAKMFIKRSCYILQNYLIFIYKHYTRNH